MLLTFDVVLDAVSEHDDWHTHEHMPERLSVPGFLRGTRWVATRAKPRYLVLYEVAQLATLTSEPYLERLNDPTPWTAKMMAHYRAMSRGFCSVTGSFGFGLGAVALLVRFEPPKDEAASLRDWLVRDALPPLASRPGVASAHLLESGSTPPMTSEQRMRGADAGVGWALLVTGYDETTLGSVAQSDLGTPALERRGAGAVVHALYELHHSLGRGELNAPDAR